MAHKAAKSIVSRSLTPLQTIKLGLLNKNPREATAILIVDLKNVGVGENVPSVGEKTFVALELEIKTNGPFSDPHELRERMQKYNKNCIRHCHTSHKVHYTSILTWLDSTFDNHRGPQIDKVGEIHIGAIEKYLGIGPVTVEAFQEVLGRTLLWQYAMQKRSIERATAVANDETLKGTTEQFIAKHTIQNHSKEKFDPYDPYGPTKLTQITIDIADKMSEYNRENKRRSCYNNVVKWLNES